MWNKFTGEVFTFGDVDATRKRLGRMRQRVYFGIMSLQACQVADGGTLTMLTLTYAKVGQWEPRHISKCMAWLRGLGIRAYVWVAELQKRGAVHYHVLYLLPAGQRWVKPDASTGGWVEGFSFVTPNVQHPFYVMKYIQKEGSKDGAFPKGLRLFGMSAWSLRRLDYSERCQERASLLPRWFSREADFDGRILDARRERGGIRYGSQLADNPYTNKEPATLDKITDTMYANWWAQGTPVA